MLRHNITEKVKKELRNCESTTQKIKTLTRVIIEYWEITKKVNKEVRVCKINLLVFLQK